MSYRNRFSLVLAALLIITLPSIAPAFTAVVVPEKTDLVVIVNNHSQLPLTDFIRTNPAIPAPGKEMFEAFTKGSSFNPLSDVAALQIMARVNEEAWVVAAHGTFDAEKITAQLKIVGDQGATNGKIKDLPAILTKDGKGAVCFPEKGLGVFGTTPMVEKFIEAHLAKKGDPAYAPLVAKVSDKAFLTIMAAGDSLGRKILSGMQAKGKTVKLGAMEAAIKEWADGHFLGGIVGKSLFANQLDDRFELWLTYDREDAKDCTYHFLSESTDKRFHVDSSVREFLKALAKMPVPVAPAAAPADEKKSEEKKQEKNQGWKKKSQDDSDGGAGEQDSSNEESSDEE